MYIQMHSMHGLFRAENIELGRDEDTGGQIIYVLNLAKAFAKLKKVKRVDIVTRRIIDKNYPGYSKIIEKVSPKVNIIRIECGPKKYIKKVKLWPHLPEFIKNCKEYFSKVGKPDILHSNYADSGCVCAILSNDLDIPQVHTGHSLGKPKMERLGVCDKNFKEMDKIYNFSKRINAEQLAIDNSKAIIISTAEEQLFQYSMYDIDIGNKKFHIVPPGVNIHKFYPRSKKEDLPAKNRILGIIKKELCSPNKPIIFTISRLDYKKNLISLVKAYAFSKKLQSLSNLVMVTGRLGKLGKNEKILMDEMENLIKNKKLEKKVLIIKHIDYKKEAGEIYRIATRSKGVFVNPALHEPFGITVIEAAACGLPVVATKEGGPVESISKCKNGYTIDPRNTVEIATKVQKILTNKRLWNKFSKNGIINVKKHYTWDSAAKKEVKIFNTLLK